MPAGRGTPGGFSPRKVILGIVLAGSIIFFFLTLFAGGVAILSEAAPRGHGGLTAVLVSVRHTIAHHAAHRK